MKIFNEPTFIPKLLDESVLKSELPYSHILVEAHYLFYRPDLIAKTREEYPKIIIDPITHSLQFPSINQKPNFKKLPYSSATDIQRILSEPSYRLNSLVVPCIDFQSQNGADFVISPYLCTDDINSTIFNNNLTLLGETLYIIEGREIKPKIFAPICIGGTTLRDRNITNYIVNSYKDKVIHDNISGFFIMVTDFDDRAADEEQLLGLADLVYQLSQEKDVIINHIGGFGEVLNAIGSSAFVSSPGGGETFSLKQMQLGKSGRTRKHDKWRYVPELFDYINEDELVEDRMNYKCECFACKNLMSYPSIYAARRTHFLIKRMEAVISLKNKTRIQRIDNMIKKLSDAQILANRYIATLSSDIKTIHLARWKKVLETAKSWNYQEDDDELEKLLKELD